MEVDRRNNRQVLEVPLVFDRVASSDPLIIGLLSTRKFGRFRGSFHILKPRFKLPKFIPHQEQHHFDNTSV